jgi:hypothetical protein
MSMIDEKKPRICSIASTDNTWVRQDIGVTEESGHKAPFNNLNALNT